MFYFSAFKISMFYSSLIFFKLAEGDECNLFNNPVNFSQTEGPFHITFHGKGRNLAIISVKLERKRNVCNDNEEDKNILL